MAEQLWRREALAPYATLPWQSRGRRSPRGRGPHPRPVPARPRPGHPLDGVPPAQAQDPGLRLSRGRPFPDKADPLASRSRRSRRIDRRALGLDEDLGEAVALAHDLGHTPFGHAGEDALHAADERPMAASTTTPRRCRILTKLEHRYAEFDGLNLTWETLEGRRQAQRPDARQARHRKARAGPPSSMFGKTRSRARHLAGAARRRSRRCPTTSPTTTTTSTTACAPACSAWPTWSCRWSARCSRWCRRSIPASARRA